MNGVPDCSVSVSCADHSPTRPRARPPFFSQRRFGPHGSSTTDRPTSGAADRSSTAPTRTRGPGRSARRPVPPAPSDEALSIDLASVYDRPPPIPPARRRRIWKLPAFMIEWPPDDSQMNGCTPGISRPAGPRFGRAQDVEVRSLDAGVAGVTRPVLAQMSRLTASRSTSESSRARSPCPRPSCWSSSTWTTAAPRRASAVPSCRSGDRFGVGKRRLRRRAAWRSTRTTAVVGDAVAAAQDRASASMRYAKPRRGPRLLASVFSRPPPGTRPCRARFRPRSPARPAVKSGVDVQVGHLAVDFDVRQRQLVAQARG